MSIRYTLRRVKESDLLQEINGGAEPNYENLKRGEMCVTDTGRVYVRRQDDTLEEFTHIAADYAQSLLNQVNSQVDNITALEAEVTALKDQAQTEIQDIASQISFMYSDLEQDVANIEETLASTQSAKDEAIGARDVILNNISDAQDSADLAEKWANYMDGTVDGNEYSAKYYATSIGNTHDQVVQTASDIETYINEQKDVLQVYVDNAEAAADRAEELTGISAITNNEIDGIVEGGGS